jgi:hypothetical protein
MLRQICLDLWLAGHKDWAAAPAVRRAAIRVPFPAKPF